jgi:hypothetical protein
VQKFSEIESEKSKEIWNVGQVVYFINENKLTKCSEVQIEIKNVAKVKAILDSGSEVNLLSERIYDLSVKSEVEVPMLPIKNVVLVAAFRRCSREEHC